MSAIRPQTSAMLSLLVLIMSLIILLSSLSISRQLCRRICCFETYFTWNQWRLDNEVVYGSATIDVSWLQMDFWRIFSKTLRNAEMFWYLEELPLLIAEYYTIGTYLSHLLYKTVLQHKNIHRDRNNSNIKVGQDSGVDTISFATNYRLRGSFRILDVDTALLTWQGDSRNWYHGVCWHTSHTCTGVLFSHIPRTRAHTQLCPHTHTRHVTFKHRWCFIHLAVDVNEAEWFAGSGRAIFLSRRKGRKCIPSLATLTWNTPLLFQ